MSIPPSDHHGNCRGYRERSKLKSAGLKKVGLRVGFG